MCGRMSPSLFGRIRESFLADFMDKMEWPLIANYKSTVDIAWSSISNPNDIEKEKWKRLFILEWILDYTRALFTFSRHFCKLWFLLSSDDFLFTIFLLGLKVERKANLIQIKKNSKKWLACCLTEKEVATSSFVYCFFDGKFGRLLFD